MQTRYVTPSIESIECILQRVLFQARLKMVGRMEGCLRPGAPGARPSPAPFTPGSALEDSVQGSHVRQLFSTFMSRPDPKFISHTAFRAADLCIAIAEYRTQMQQTAGWSEQYK
jgi:hypothetical protein